MSGSVACAVVPILLAWAPALRAEPASTGPGGPWALEMRVVSAADVPVIGEVRSTTVTRGLLEGVAGLGGEAQRYTVCDVALAGQRGRIRSTLPEAFIRALPVRDVLARFEDGRYRADLGVVPLGFDLAASGGALPRSAGDPAVLDFEGDGAPGFTVLVDMPLFPTVAIHLVQVTASVLEGEQVDGDRVAGRPRVSRLEQRVLGASLPAFARSPRIRPVDGAGSFELRRLPEGSTCREVLALWGGDRA
jgi:hypothetical protein